ncbi:Gfo/Idh/MocA family protein [Fictibacillus fluitans]|uniref:Gfo/Idh/MocA family oxidoreductase n=1 Tax=Fictibacillus fluitans TaxID=3058422 RepID=A0ABT8HQB1_9BACL|nr:Gfo/Idh/MocA family oxidoreductase [Fictibacillus sp. NE201]MDN4522957.1 Gfo/Idh/MocA family oxidoreductase [Fictibacillus sp. NE201]
MEKTRFIQIGSGGFGQSWLNVAMKYEQVELVGVVDMMEENLAQAKQLTGLPEEALFTNIDEALGQIEAEAVLIVTPPQTHKELAIKAIQHGFHVMMEKPLAHTLEEAKELLHFKQNHQQQLMVSQNYRWNRPIQTVKQLLDANEIGKVEWMNYSFQRTSRFGGWRDRYDHILLEDMSIHHFDLMRYLLNKDPVEVYAQSYRPSWSWFQGNPNAHVSITFEDDVHVSYTGSWVTKGKETPWNGEFRLVGEKGAIELMEDKVILYDGNNKERDVPLVDLPFDDRTLSLDNFVQSILTCNQPATSIEDNIKSYELTCASIESAVTHQAVKLPLYLVQN